MSTTTQETVRIGIAAQILAGFCANPAVFAPDERCGWSLRNCTEQDVTGYALKLADLLLDEANPKEAPELMTKEENP